MKINQCNIAHNGMDKKIIISIDTKKKKRAGGWGEYRQYLLLVSIGHIQVNM